MKFSSPDLKFKCKLEHLHTFLEYLREIDRHFIYYSEVFNVGATYKALIKENVLKISEKTAALIFKYAGENKKLITVKLTHTERLSMLTLINHFPLPLQINFFEYEITNKLILN